MAATPQEMLRELDEVRDFRRSFPQRAESEVDRKMKRRGGPAGLDSPDVRTDLRIWAIDALAELAAETSARTAETALSTRIWPPAAEEDLAGVEAERQTRSVVSTTIAEGTELLENLPDEQTVTLLQKVDTPTSHKGQAVRAPTAQVQEPSQSSPTVTLSPTTEASVAQRHQG